jgi:predicted DNA-binding transcriptional regulator AlpA
MGVKYLTGKAVCERYGGVSIRTVDRWVKEGTFPKPFYLGPRKYWPESALDEHDERKVSREMPMSVRALGDRLPHPPAKSRPPQASCIQSGSRAMTMVCAWCDVYDRIECGSQGDDFDVAWTKCRLCGRTELRWEKLGRQTPVPQDDAAEPPSAA